MADSVIYFPSIRVPETGWFTRVLLYWDTVGTIVPAEYLNDPHFLQPYTAGLKDCGLLTAVTADSGVWEAMNYYHSFLSLIDCLHLPPHDPLHVRETELVHVDKVSTGLASELAVRGLAALASGKEWDGWFRIEKQTADLLMAYLAALLGQRQGNRMDPITDSTGCLKAFTRVPFAGATVTPRLEPIRAELLGDLLPAPVDLPSPTDLAQFKERHRDLLARFRNAVEQRIVSAAAIADPDLRARSIQLMRNELRGETEVIARRMEEHKWNRIGFGALVAVVAGAVVLSDAFVTGGALTVAGASLGLASAVYAGFDGARTPRDLLARPMAYAALAHSKLGA